MLFTYHRNRKMEINNYVETDSFKESLELVKSRLESNEENLNIKRWSITNTEKKDESISILKAKEKIKEYIANYFYEESARLSLEIVNYIIHKVENTSEQLLLPLKIASDTIIDIKGHYLTLFDEYKKTKEELELLKTVHIETMQENSYLSKRLIYPEIFKKEIKAYEDYIEEKLCENVRLKDEIIQKEESEESKKKVIIKKTTIKELENIFKGFAMNIGKDEQWKHYVLERKKKKWMLQL